MGHLTKALAIAVIAALGCACGPGDSRSNPALAVSPSAGPSATAATFVSPAPSPVSPSSTPAVLVRCEDLPDQTFTSDTFRFNIGCPNNFTWQTFNQSPGRLFSARAVDDKYSSGYPAGEVDISVVANSGNSLRDWVASHIGQPGSADTSHFWDSTSNLTDIQIAGRPALGFDYLLVGPEGPPTVQAAAFVLPEGSVLLIAWWSYSSDYRPVIASVAQQMIASIQPFGA